MVIQAWVGWARTPGLTLLLPDLARTEILTLHPDAAGLFDDLCRRGRALGIQRHRGGKQCLVDPRRCGDMRL